MYDKQPDAASPQRAADTGGGEAGAGPMPYMSPAEAQSAELRAHGGYDEGGGAGGADGDGAEASGDVLSRVEQLMSYGAFDWAITDAEATEALGLLAGLETDALAATLAGLDDTFKTRLLDNMPAAARQTAAFTRVLVALGPAAVQPYVEDLLSYGLFDWAVTDSDAARVFELLVALPDGHKATLWGALSAELRARLVDNLQRGEGLSAEQQAGLRALFDATPDGEIATLCGLMKLRFRVTFQATGDEDETPLDWEKGGLTRMWDVLAALPPAHVEGNSALAFVERYQHDEGASAGGYYWSGRDNVAMAYDPDTLEDANRAARQGVEREDGTRVDDPLYGVNRFDKVARHEVGHAVDDANGHADAYCVGNAGGGDWSSLATNRVAETLVGASAGPISSWADADQKTAIIDCLQGVIDDRAPGELDDRIDAIAGLDDTQKATVKTDQAVDVLRGCFAMRGHNPWYKFPDTGGTALGGRIYQEAYSGDWWSYSQATRARKVSTYQFRAPGEWFAEAYAAYYQPSTHKGEFLERVDAATKAWFDANVDPDGGRPGPEDPMEQMGDFPMTPGGDGTAVV